MWNHKNRNNSVILSVLLVLSGASAFVEELDDSFMEMRDADDIWLIKFYAPWCTFCKQLDPVWHQIGSELRSLGSPVNVGKSDGTSNTGLAKEFMIRGYPAIFILKKDLKYNYVGPRTKDGIMDFTNRVSGPTVRSLSSPQLFQHAMRRHDTLFVYVGATSLLKGNYTAAAEELIIHTYFFSATRDVLPKIVSVPSLPAVVVFKEGTYFTYDEERDGDLKSWINRERFSNFAKIDSFTLYAMGETGKLVVLALVEAECQSEQSLRYKGLVENVAAGNSDKYKRSFYFGFMDEHEFIRGLTMSDVIVPSFIVIDLSNDGYFLPSVATETEQQLMDFLNQVLDGSVKCQGGNGITQRIRRVVYEIKTMLTAVFAQAPLIGCLLIGMPLAIMAFVFYVCCKSVRLPDGDDDVAITASSQQRRAHGNKKSD